MLWWKRTLRGEFERTLKRVGFTRIGVIMWEKPMLDRTVVAHVGIDGGFVLHRHKAPYFHEGLQGLITRFNAPDELELAVIWESLGP